MHHMLVMGVPHWYTADQSPELMIACGRHASLACPCEKQTSPTTNRFVGSSSLIATAHSAQSLAKQTRVSMCIASCFIATGLYHSLSPHCGTHREDKLSLTQMQHNKTPAGVLSVEPSEIEPAHVGFVENVVITRSAPQLALTTSANAKDSLLLAANALVRRVE